MNERTRLRGERDSGLGAMLINKCLGCWRMSSGTNVVEDPGEVGGDSRVDSGRADGTAFARTEGHDPRQHSPRRTALVHHERASGVAAAGVGSVLGATSAQLRVGDGLVPTLEGLLALETVHHGHRGLQLHGASRVCKIYQRNMSPESVRINTKRSR